MIFFELCVLPYTSLYNIVQVVSCKVLNYFNIVADVGEIKIKIFHDYKI